MDKFYRSITLKQITIIAFIVHIIIAFFSSGFHHFDEHFQIYEFLNFKLGLSGLETIPGDYFAKYRPWFQVSIYYLLYKVFNSLGVDSPFALATIYRLFTSIFGMVALLSILPIIKRDFIEKKWQKLTWILVNFSWFVPYIFVRTSSESFGISFFLIGMSLFIPQALLSDKPKSRYFLAGIMFGASYLSRYQLGLCVASVWFWGLLLRKVKLIHLVLTALAIVVMFGVESAINYWGYGEWVFAIYNYYENNFIKSGISVVTQYPLWWYFRLSLFRGLPPTSIPFMIATIWFWIKRWRSPWVFATVPLFIFHSYIGHKELRYIFIVIAISPLFLAYMIYQYHEGLASWWKKSKSFRIITWITGVMNILILLIAIFRAANPAINLYKYVYEHPEINELQFLKGTNPYVMVHLTLAYYKKPEIKLSEFEKIEEIGSMTGTNFIYFSRAKYMKEMDQFPNCKRIYTTYPEWILYFNIGNWVSRSRVWSIYRCI